MQFPPGLTLDQKFAYALALAQERRDARKAKGAKPQCRDKPLVSKTGRVVKPATVQCGSVCRQKQNCRITKKQLDQVRKQMPGASRREVAEAIKKAMAKKREGMGTKGALYEGTKGARGARGNERIEARKRKGEAQSKPNPDGHFPPTTSPSFKKSDSIPQWVQSRKGGKVSRTATKVKGEVLGVMGIPDGQSSIYVAGLAVANAKSRGDAKSLAKGIYARVGDHPDVISLGGVSPSAAQSKEQQRGVYRLRKAMVEAWDEMVQSASDPVKFSLREPDQVHDARQMIRDFEITEKGNVREIRGSESRNRRASAIAENRRLRKEARERQSRIRQQIEEQRKGSEAEPPSPSKPEATKESATSTNRRSPKKKVQASSTPQPVTPPKSKRDIKELGAFLSSRTEIGGKFYEEDLFSDFPKPMLDYLKGTGILLSEKGGYRVAPISDLPLADTQIAKDFPDFALREQDIMEMEQNASEYKKVQEKRKAKAEKDRKAKGKEYGDWHDSFVSSVESAIESGETIYVPTQTKLHPIDPGTLSVDPKYRDRIYYTVNGRQVRLSDSQIQAIAGVTGLGDYPYLARFRGDSASLPHLGFGLNPTPFYHPLWDLMGY